MPSSQENKRQKLRYVPVTQELQSLKYKAVKGNRNNILVCHSKCVEITVNLKGIKTYM